MSNNSSLPGVIIGSPVVDDPSSNISLHVGAHVQPFLDWPSNLDSEPGSGVVVARGSRVGLVLIQWTKNNSNNNSNNAPSTSVAEHRAGAGGAYDLCYCDEPHQEKMNAIRNVASELENQHGQLQSAAAAAATLALSTLERSSMEANTTSAVATSESTQKETNGDDDEDDETHRTGKAKSPLAASSSSSPHHLPSIIPSCMVDPKDDYPELKLDCFVHPEGPTGGVVNAAAQNNNFKKHCWVKPGIDWKGRKEEGNKRGVTLRPSSSSSSSSSSFEKRLQGKVLVLWLDGSVSDHFCGKDNIFELCYCDRPSVNNNKSKNDDDDCLAIPGKVVTESNFVIGSFVTIGPDWKWGRQNEPGGVGRLVKYGNVKDSHNQQKSVKGEKSNVDENDDDDDDDRPESSTSNNNVNKKYNPEEDDFVIIRDRTQIGGWALVEWLISGYTNIYRLAPTRGGDLKYVSRDEAMKMLEKAKEEDEAMKLLQFRQQTTSENLYYLSSDNSNANKPLQPYISSSTTTTTTTTTSTTVDEIVPTPQHQQKIQSKAQQQDESDSDGGGIDQDDDDDDDVDENNTKNRRKFMKMQTSYSTSVVNNIKTNNNTNDTSTTLLTPNNNSNSSPYQFLPIQQQQQQPTTSREFMLHPPAEPRDDGRGFSTWIANKIKTQPTEYRPKWSTEALRYFCGLRYCPEFQCKCGKCDGCCGPTNGCCCPICERCQPRFCGCDFLNQEKVKFQICGPMNGMCLKCYGVTFPMVSVPAAAAAASISSPLTAVASFGNHNNNNNNFPAVSSSSSSSLLFASSSSSSPQQNNNNDLMTTTSALFQHLPPELRDFPHTAIYTENSFRIVKKIGAGAGGEVFEAVLIANNLSVAIKMFSRTSLDLLTGEPDPTWLANIAECKRSFTLNHKNIVRLLGIFVAVAPSASSSAFLVQKMHSQQNSATFFPNSNNTFNDPALGSNTLQNQNSSSSSMAVPLRLGMIMELADTNLHFLLMNHQLKFKAGRTKHKLLPRQTIESYGSQIAQGLAYLHSTRTLWLDAKPHNTLVFQDSHILRLADFGLAQVMSGEKSVTMAQLIGAGTYRWMAPESATTPHVGPKNDIYSLGCILFFLLTGSQPWEDEFEGQNLRMIPNQEKLTPLFQQVRVKVAEYNIQQQQQLQANNNNNSSNFANPIPEYLIELCARCLQLDPKLRPSSPELVEAFKMKVAYPPNFVDGIEDQSFATKKNSTMIFSGQGNNQQQQNGENSTEGEQTVQLGGEFSSVAGSEATNYKSQRLIPVAFDCLPM